MGQYVLSTNNGLAKGDIYRIERLKLGKFTLNGAPLGVLDLTVSAGWTVF